MFCPELSRRAIARILVSLTTAVWLGAPAVLAADPPVPSLTLADLVNRPDHWPPYVSLPKDMHLTNGTVLHQGDKAKIVKFDGTKVYLVDDKARLAISPTDCALLEAANDAWQKLTPAQRAIDIKTLASDPTVWPVQVQALSQIGSSMGSMPAGSSLSVVDVTANGIVCAWPSTGGKINLPFDVTDVIEKARALALIDVDKRPSPIAAALADLVIDSSGKPVHDEHLKDRRIFAFYFGAGWCPPCHEFSPDFVKFMNEAGPAHPELQTVFLSRDKTPADMLAYMKQENMPFPGVRMNDIDHSAVLNKYSAQIIPQLIIVDRFGKVLASNDDHNGNRGDPKDTIEDLRKLLANGPTTKP